VLFVRVLDLLFYGWLKSVVTDYPQSYRTDEVNQLSGFSRQEAEAQSLFGFATDLTDWAYFHRVFCRW
jgi:hypothetical protein